tara:strand:+ start:344 stop:1396 length:1053 start_codon:yes stop_codon:yes gene_type:complete
MASEIRTNSITSRTGLSTISLTSTGPVFAGIATFTGSIGVAGTLTYEDVTNIDSVGVITARSHLQIPNDTGELKLGASGDFRLFHNGTSNKIIAQNGELLVQCNTYSIRNENGSSTYLNIDSSGNVGVKETTPDFSGFGSNGGGIELDDVNSGFTALKVSHGAADMYLASAGSAAFISTRTNHDIIVEKNSTEVARFTDNGLKVPSGKGIDFSSTGDAGGMTSELLDDYEEGSWTPTAHGYTGSNTSNNCHYTKIGRLVTATFRITWPSLTSSTSAEIRGLPFTCISTGQYVFGGAFSETNDNDNLSMIVKSGSTSMLILRCTSSGVDTQNINEVSTKDFRGTISYFTDS